jgi:hypothetical protein
MTIYKQSTFAISILLASIATVCNALSQDNLSRRDWAVSLLTHGTTALIASTSQQASASPIHSASHLQALDEFPLFLRDFTKLAPLGAPQQYTDKTLNLPLDTLAKRLQDSLLYGATGQGGYILSGDFATDLFVDDCLFVDPNNRVKSLSQCQTALKILFDPKQSSIQMLDPLTVQTVDSEQVITGRFRIRGFLQFPWRPYITAYESTIVYKVDPETHLVTEQYQTWTKSATKALQESFTPTIFTPPPRSNLQASSSESMQVTRLFDQVNGRRPYEYSPAERVEIARLVQEILDKQPSDNSQSSSIIGKWMLVYLEPGPTGAGVDRRVPFPELGFNDQYQVFTADRITNIGEILGPLVDVRVAGPWSINKGGLQTSLAFDKVPVYQADITGGQVCLNSGGLCVGGLPIKGHGLFQVPYLGDRLRILQNLNGGGARGVQIRIE